MNVFNKKPSYSLDITLNEDFNGIMYGPPEESLGCKLKGKIILENKVSLSARQLTFVFLGITTVSCGPPMSSSRPEYSETQTIYRKQLSFHNSAFSGKTIPIGIHEYHFEVDLPGSLPPSFKRSRGKIEYSCNAILERPRFHKDIKIKKIVNIQRCLMDQVSAYNTTITEDTLNGRIQYQLNTPIMVYREGGLVQAELRLKPMNSDIVIEAVEYGLKEQIHFRTTGEHQMSVIASINEDHYPLGKKEVATNPFFVNGSEPMSIQFRLCPWVNCDMDSPLIEIRHKISYTVCISESVPVEVESDSEPYGFVPPIRSRRYSVPVSINSDDESHTGSRRGRVHRTVSLVPIPNNTSSNPRRNSRTLSIRTILNSLTQTKIEKRRLNFEVPIIVTAKSERSRLRGLSYISDRPPDYAVVASMFPSPPEYHHNTSHENDLSHEDYLLQENEENDLSDDHEDTI